MSRPITVLHLTTFYPPYSFGGDAMYIYRLSHALAEEGHQVDVVHCLDSYHLLHPAEPEIQYDEHPNIHRHGLRSGYGGLSPLLTQQTGQPFLKRKQIQELLSNKPYDVLHYHNISLLGPAILAVQPENREVVKLYTTHEHWLICPTHVLWKFNSHPCEKPQCLPCTLLAKRPPQLWRYTGLLERMSQHVDQFVSPSRFTAEMHAARGFPQPVGHLPYFIHRADQDWQHPSAPPQVQPYFLFVGRLESIKGLQTLIEIWEHVPDYDLLVAGTGKQEGELRSQAGNNPRVKFLGPLTQRELGNIYFHAIATIVPSITYETFGIIIVESFARKTPVIVRDLGALPEVVRDSNGGFIYRDDAQLLDAILHLANSAELRHDLGENGYAAFIRMWSKEAHLEMYFDLITQIALKKYGRIPWDD